MSVLIDTLLTLLAPLPALLDPDVLVPLGKSPWYCELMPWLRICR